jgi:hypothetical protein
VRGGMAEAKRVVASVTGEEEVWLVLDYLLLEV